MTTGFATVSGNTYYFHNTSFAYRFFLRVTIKDYWCFYVLGTVLAAYINYGANPAYLITSTVMSAPAALCYSKLLYPEKEEIVVNNKHIKEIDV